MEGIVLGVIATGVTVVVVIVGATWRIGIRFARLESKLQVVEERLKALPSDEKITERIREHRELCPAWRDYSTSAGSAGFIHDGD